MKLNRKEEIKVILKNTLFKIYSESKNYYHNDNLDMLVACSTEIVDLSESLNSYLLELEEINKINE